MDKVLKYYLIGFLFLAACESIYTPELDMVENVLVVDARLVAGDYGNQIILKWSKGFNEDGRFDPVMNARVTITDSMERVFLTNENSPGIYTLTEQLGNSGKYKLNITVGNDIYISEFETVPPVPDIDTLYNEHAEQWIQPGGETNANDFIKYPGQQLYVDMNEVDEERYYRFYARKIHQFYFPFDTVMFGLPVTEFKYAWRSYYPQDSYNIAGPAEYSSSKSIVKHPVEFFLYNEGSFLDTAQRGMGWIYIMHQYGITESAYRFYKDLNSQLESEGKIFDPLYIQARNNLHCVTDSQKIVLGNFEIASYREHRFYIRLSSNSDFHTIRPIVEYHDIPLRGVQPIEFPWFWEH